MDINSCVLELKEYYDRAYLSYLKKKPTRIILTTLLSDVINLLGGGKGVIIEPDTHSVMAVTSSSDSDSIDNSSLGINDWLYTSFKKSSKNRINILKSIITQ